MSEPIIYLDGEYTNAANAKISIFERGLLFGDAVYEVIPVYNGKACFVERHLARLQSSLHKARIIMPEIDWLPIFNRLIADNSKGDMQLYIQITRGNQHLRKHDIPAQLKPTIFAFTLNNPYPLNDQIKRGLHASLLEDYRWQRCDIKTTSLLANVLLHDDAIKDGNDTSILMRNGILTEGSASNVFIVDNEGIKTPVQNNFCLPGITRQLVIELIEEMDLPFQETNIPAQDIFKAKEVWITSTAKEIYPVTRVNNTQIGDGQGGAYWSQVHQEYKLLINDYYDR